VRVTVVQIAIGVGIGGTLLCIAVPAFVANLRASKMSEPVSNLGQIVEHAIVYGDKHDGETSLPPSVELTPKDVPKASAIVDAKGTWDHLTWRALGFGLTEAHSYAYQYSMTYDPASGKSSFEVTAHGDLDGDGQLSTFSVFGEKQRGGATRALPGMYIDREVE